MTMKNNNQLVLIAILLFLTCIGYGQSFQKTIHIEDADLNHYSIETNSEQQYVYAGTIFNENENNDIHLLKLDATGTIIWEVFLNKSNDDRALDITLDTEDNIIITGYTTPNVSDRPELFLAKFDTNGTLLKSVTLENLGAVGTNVMYSSTTENFIVGGLGIDQLSFPFSQNYAIVARFDIDLKYLNHIEFIEDTYANSSINDIVEVPGGYFVTGGIGTESGRVVDGITRFGSQGVLAVFLDYQLGMNKNISFESTNARHIGVSAVFNELNDEIYLMSNNSILHNPQITTIKDITSSPFISNHYALLIDATATLNAAGFELRLDNEGALVAAGYFRTFDNTSSTVGYTHPWYIKFKPDSGAQIEGFVWPTHAPEFSFHGGGFLSTFLFESPLLYNQEILTERTDGRGWVFVSPREVEEKFSVDIVTTGNATEMNCFEAWNFTSNPRIAYNVKLQYNNLDSFSTLIHNFDQVDYRTRISDVCDESHRTNREAPIQDNYNIKNLEIDVVNFSVYPNPTSTIFNVELTGKDLNGGIVLTDATGQIVYTSQILAEDYNKLIINVENLKKGVYFLSFQSGENKMIKKLIKY